MAKSTRPISKLQRAYNKLRSDKKKFCQGKLTKSAVKATASNYVKAKVASAENGTKEKVRKEAKRIANRVLGAVCTMSASIGKKKKSTRKKATRRKKRA